MDLSYTPEQIAFRKEVRTWLEENIPAEPLKSFDTEEGFNQHREWEKELSGLPGPGEAGLQHLLQGSRWKGDLEVRGSPWRFHQQV